MNKSNKKTFLRKNKKYGQGFSASLMDGPSVNFFEIADVEYSDELNDAVWGKHNWQSLLDECSSALIITLKEYDLAPGQSDVTFWVAIDDATEFRQELREVILNCLNQLNS